MREMGPNGSKMADTSDTKRWLWAEKGQVRGSQATSASHDQFQANRVLIFFESGILDPRASKKNIERLIQRNPFY